MPSESDAPTLNVSLRPSTDVSTAVAVISAPRPDGLICVTFISDPTVDDPSGSPAATASIAAFSIKAIIAGVANTSMSPEPMAFAVFSEDTVVRLVNDKPVFNMTVKIYYTTVF